MKNRTTNHNHQKKIRFADLTEGQQEQVQKSREILEEIHRSPEQEVLDQKVDAFHTEFDRALEALREEKLTTGALFIVTSIVLDFAEQALDKDPGSFEYNPFAGDTHKFLRALLSDYLDEDSSFWRARSAMASARARIERLKTERLDQAANEMFGSKNSWNRKEKRRQTSPSLGPTKASRSSSGFTGQSRSYTQQALPTCRGW